MNFAAAGTLALVACAPAPERMAPELQLPIAQSGWQPWIVDFRKPATLYSLVMDGGRTVLRAEAQRSVSGLMRDVRIDAAAHPVLRWHWKVERLVAAADEHRADGDDSAARLFIAFAGDPSRLDSAERAKLALASAFSGREAPYAMLMYIWSTLYPPETIISNPRSSRVRMIVVEQGAPRLGRWLDYERDVARDYRRAFGEEPGVVTGVGVLTDADDTQSAALAYYGDIAFRPARLAEPN